MANPSAADALKEAKRVLSQIEEDAFEESALSGYRIAEANSTYAGIPQRWLIVESEARREAANEQMDRRLPKSEEPLRKRLKKLEKEDFECEADALKAASSFAKELRHHELTQLRLESGFRHDKPGRPAKDASHRKVYSVRAILERDEAALAKARQRSGRFILSTNAVSVVPGKERYTNDELLKEYKAQRSRPSEDFASSKTLCFSPPASSS